MAKKNILANIARLLAVEAVGLFLLKYVLLYAFNIDIFNFSTPRGQWIGIGIGVFVMYTLYHEVVSGDFVKLGAEAAYDQGDNRRRIAQQRIGISKRV